jgi:hypothetical protein
MGQNQGVQRSTVYGVHALVRLILSTLGILGSCVSRIVPPSLPSRAEFESRVAGVIGSRERTTVTVSCEEPHRPGWSCTMRDADGRRGWVSASAEASEVVYRSDFELTSDGIHDRVYHPTAAVEPDTLLAVAGMNALRSLGRDAFPLFDCPPVPKAVSTTTCAAESPFPGRDRRPGGRRIGAGAVRRRPRRQGLRPLAASLMP